MKCKECKSWDNTIPVTTVKNNDGHKFAEDYIGKCNNIERAKMMNDYCQLFEKKEENNE